MKRKIAESKTTRLWCPKSAGCFLWSIYFHSSAITHCKLLQSFEHQVVRCETWKNSALDGSRYVKSQPDQVLLHMRVSWSSGSSTSTSSTMFYQYPSVQMSHRVIEHAIVQVSSISAVSCHKLSMCQACSGSVLSRTDVLLSWIRPAWDWGTTDVEEWIKCLPH